MAVLSRERADSLSQMEARIAVELSETSQAAMTNWPVFEDRKRRAIEAVQQGGGTYVPVEEASGLIWLTVDDAQSLKTTLEANPQLKWVQLPWAGVDAFASQGLLNDRVVYTCAKGIYGGQVGEHALSLIMACLKQTVIQARTPHWHRIEPDQLEGKRVTILGAGGIAETLARYLQAGDCDITVLRKNVRPFELANRTLSISDLHSVLPETEILVLALALTPDTHHIIGREELAMLPQGSIVVNVARGPHIDTEALVEALDSGHIAAAGLDVTDPEPLPADHRLWQTSKAFISSHSADSEAYVTSELAKRIARNVEKFANDEALEGVVDITLGY